MHEITIISVVEFLFYKNGLEWQTVHLFWGLYSSIPLKIQSLLKFKTEAQLCLIVFLEEHSRQCLKVLLNCSCAGARACQTQHGLLKQGTSKGRIKELPSGCLTVIITPLSVRLWQNHNKFCSALLYEKKNLKFILLKKAVPSFTQKSMISSDDFRFTVPWMEEEFDP